MLGSRTFLRPGDRERTGGLRRDIPGPDHLPKPGLLDDSRLAPFRPPKSPRSPSIRPAARPSRSRPRVPAASDESAAVAPGSRITGNARVRRPPGWLISRRPGSGQRIAARIRAGLAFTGGLCDGPGFQGDAVGGRGSPFTRGCPRSGFRAEWMLSGPAAGTSTLRPPGLSPAEQRRPAADIWQAVPKEVTPCRTSREEQPGPIS